MKSTESLNEPFIGPLEKHVYSSVHAKWGIPQYDPLAHEIAPYYYVNTDNVYIISALRTAREAELKVRMEGRMDTKTGLLNELAFSEELNGIAEHRRAEDQTGTALVVLDGLGFGEINNKYGHSVGDQVLGYIGNALRKVGLRERDLIYRIGGDEFAILFRFDPNSISEEDFIIMVEGRIKNFPVEEIPHLEGFRWNHAVYRSGMTAKEFFKAADVKGENRAAKIVRAHNQTPEEYQEAWATAMATS